MAEVTEVQNFIAAVVARRSVSQLDPDSAMPDDAKSVNPDEAKSVNPDAQSVSADESFLVVAESVNSDAEIFPVDAENVKLGLSKSVNPDVTEKSVNADAENVKPDISMSVNPDVEESVNQDAAKSRSAYAQSEIRCPECPRRCRTRRA